MITIKKLALIMAVASCVALPDSAAQAASSGGGGATNMPSMPAIERTPEDLARAAFSTGVRQIKKAESYEEDALKATKPAKQEKAQKKAAAAFQKAAEEFEKSVGNSPANHDAWNYLGYAQRHLGRHEQALGSYAQALRLKPGFPEAIEYRAEAYLELNRFEEARAAYMDLFGRARPLADQLLSAMQQYVADRKQAADGSEAVEAFAKWVEERAAIAQQTAWDHVGDEFEAVITAVVEFGIFVQLANLQVDGLVHASSLRSDQYDYEPARCAWAGRRTRRMYQLGMRVAVRLKRVDMAERRLDFEIATEPEAGAVRQQERPRSTRRRRG